MIPLKPSTARAVMLLAMLASAGFDLTPPVPPSETEADRKNRLFRAKARAWFRREAARHG